MLRQKGVSILELMLVICVVAVLLLAAVSRYQRYQVTMDSEQVKKSVSLLQQGLTDYFFEKCKLAAPGPVLGKTSAKTFLTDWNNPDWDVNKLQLINPLGSDYQVEITDGRTVPNKQFWLKVYAKLDNVNADAMLTYKEMLQASGCVDAQGNDEPSCISKILVWQKLPWYSTPGISSDLWILAGSLQHSAPTANDVCKGTI